MDSNINIPSEIYKAIKLPEKRKKKLLILEIAITLYDKNILSFGKAREFAGMTKLEFHNELGKRQIERHYDKENFLEDLKFSEQ